MSHGPEMTLQIRAAIIVYRFEIGWTYRQISSKLSESEEAIKSLCQRVKKRSESDHGPLESKWITNLLKYIENEPRRGRNQRAPPGSKLAVAVRRALEDYDNEERVVAARQGVKEQQALGELDPNIVSLAKKQVLNIAEDKRHCEADPIESRQLKRKRVIDKPVLDQNDKKQRLEYCDIVDEYYRRNSLLIQCDEKAYHFGGSKNRKHVTAPSAVVVYGSRARTRFSVEQWAAGCAGDVSITRPHCCWSLKAQDAPELASKLLEANQQARAAVNLRRLRCTIEGTHEYDELKRRNDEIYQYNTKRSNQRQGARKNTLTPARLYPYEDLKASGDKGGLNFVWYAFEVLQKHLFPYYEAIQSNNNDRHVVIIEDNDPSHLKARRLLAAEIVARNIEFAPHPANSPDFNHIETIQKYHNKLTEDYRVNITSATRAVVIEAEGYLKQSWQSNKMDEYWLQRASIDALKEVADRCRDAEGSNTFKDDINSFKC